MKNLLAVASLPLCLVRINSYNSQKSRKNLAERWNKVVQRNACAV